MQCPPSNQVAIDQSKFFDSDGVHWSSHSIGWTVAGVATALTLIVSAVSILSHTRNYTNPLQQRQILRILYMPPVYSIVSFFSYRFFRHYAYFMFILSTYEAICIGSFLLLLIEYAAATSLSGATGALQRKDKVPMPVPFCCWRYRPTKAYFMPTVKWSVLQYSIAQPVASIIGVICQVLDVLCVQRKLLPGYASMYLMIFTFLSNLIAGYGLNMFESLMAEELRGRRPKAKFLAIKLVLMFTFYQSFVLSILEGRVIHGTRYWTATNIANGMSSLLVCVEGILFSLFMAWAYSANEYRCPPGIPPTSIWRPLWDSVNLSDFVIEIAGSIRYYWGAATQKQPKKRRPNFAEAFGVEGRRSSGSAPGYPVTSSSGRTLLQAASPMPYSTQSLPHDDSIIPFTTMDTMGSNKKVEVRQSSIGLAH